MRSKGNTKRRASWIVAVMLLVAACGGNTSGAGSDGGDGTSSDGSAATSTSDDGAAASGGDGAQAFNALVESPAPDNSEMTPTDDAPDFSWMLIRAYATVTAGGHTVDFFGVDPIWTTEFNPMGIAVGYDTIAGCSVIQSSDGQVIAQASFHTATERNLHSSFSMSDNGDGTVIWGFYNKDTGEEWSATGSGAASIRYAIHTHPSNGDANELLGLADDDDNLWVLIDFEGEADENFTTEKSGASSRVLCEFAKRAA